MIKQLKDLRDGRRANDGGSMKAALAQGADVNASSREDGSSLDIAALRGRADVVKALPDHAAYVDSPDVVRSKPVDTT